MILRQHEGHWGIARKFFFALVAAFCVGPLFSPTTASAGLLAGDVALIGWIDNGSPDSFAFVALAPISAGENIYFTDNGWTGTQFRSPAADDGDGNETLTKWSAVSNIPAGAIIRTTDVSPDFLWTTTGAVPGGASGTFAPLSIGNPAEQVYAFQGTDNLPMQNVTSQLFVLDDTGAFENAIGSDTGTIPAGLSALDNTALTLPVSFGSPRFIMFNTASLASGTKAEWLAAISNPENWTSAATGTLPTGSISVVPEPASWILAISGLALCGWVRARKRAH